MIIRDMFEKDINRSINGVIKVSQDDERSIKQELSEYVVTRELQGHFAHFFEAGLKIAFSTAVIWAIYKTDSESSIIPRIARRKSGRFLLTPSIHQVV